MAGRQMMDTSPPRRRRRVSPIECDNDASDSVRCSTGSYGFSESRLVASRSPLVIPCADMGGQVTPAAIKVVSRARMVTGATPPPAAGIKSPSTPWGMRSRVPVVNRTMAPTPVVTSAPKKRAPAGGHAGTRAAAMDASDEDGEDDYDANATSGNTKGPWSQEEDDLLAFLVKQDGARNWRKIAQRLNGRCVLKLP
jgi:hypothetical protein